MQLLVNKTFVECTCANCGCLYAMTEHYREQRRRDHVHFYCPNGHSNYIPAETEEERLQRELAKEISRRAAAEHERDKARAKLKRVEAGTCPECDQSFPNLKKHISSVHLKEVKK